METSSDENESGGENFDSFAEAPAEKRKLKMIHNSEAKRVKYTKRGDISKVDNKNNPRKGQPTMDELNVLKETESLYNSGLFRLQIEELISAVKVKEKHKRAFTEWFENFRTLLNSLPECSEVKLSTIEKLKKHKGIKKLSANDALSLQLSKCDTYLKCDQDLTMSFCKPENVYAFGLHRVNSLPGPQFKISINIEIPKKFFHAKDYQNNRYFVKKYYYLLFIATALQNAELCSKIECTCYQGIDLLPVVQVTPKNSNKTSITLHVTPEEDCFKLTRFLPDKNNVKQNVFNKEFFDVDQEIMKWTQTLSYNSALLHDITLKTNMQYIEEILSEYENIQEAIKLLCIWARQRDLLSNDSLLTEEIIAYVIVYLIQQKRINKYMSSYQVIKCFWDLLIKNDLREHPIFICNPPSEDTLVDFQNNYDIVILDRTGFYNVASFLNEGFYEKLKKECYLGFSLIDTSSLQAFHNLFITRLPVMLQYDLVIDIKDTSKFQAVYSAAKEQDKAKYFGNYQSLIVKYIYEVLKKGLENRATLIVPYVPTSNSWKITEQNKRIFDRILFGINLDAEYAFNCIQHGPSLDDPREKEFRDFWGPLSSDRRFRDGTACVTLYFETKTVKDRRNIMNQIVDYLIKDKMKLKYMLYYNEMESILTNPNVIAPYETGTNEEPTLKAIQVSDNLSKKLRELDMSLSVTGVQGISSLFSYTDCFPPLQTTYKCGKTVTKSEGDIIVLNETKLSVIPKFVKPIECVLQLERSSKWPNDLQALHFMKTMFCLEIAKQLENKYSIITSVKRDFIDIFSEGLVFRYRLYVPKEISLLKKVIKDDGTIYYEDTPESLLLEKKLDVLPQVRSALKGLQLQNSCYGPSTALIKRWLRAHLLDDYYFPSIVLELLNASLYINSSPFVPASTPQIAFFRFMKFFAELQWDLQPVIVNFNNTLTKEEISEIESILEKDRSAHPPLYIITPYDKGESVFTKDAPSKEVLFRVKKLAQASLDLFQNITEMLSLSFKDLFIPNMDGYNLLIHLKPLLNSRRHEQVTVDSIKKLVLEPYNPKERQKMPVVEFSPVDIYLRELRENYGKFANFFHDSYGGNVIGVLWKPEIFTEKEFQIAHVCARKVIGDKLVVNIDVLIDDFYVLGKDIVKFIEKK